MIPKILNKFIKGPQRSKLAKKHIIYSLLLNVISVVIGIMFVPLLLNYLDSERYGIWLTLTSIVGWFTFFDAGLGNGLRNKLTEAFAKEDTLLAKEYISTTYAIIGSIFIVVLIIFYLINPFLNWDQILNTSTVPSKELSVLALIVFTFFFLRFILNLIGVILMADQRPAYNRVLGPITNLISITIIFILSKTTQGDLVIMGFVMSAVPVVVLSIASFLLFNKRYKLVKPEFKSIKWTHSNSLMGLGFKFFIIQIATLIMFTSSNMIIIQVLGPDEVTVYNVAFKYFQVPLMLYTTIMLPIWSAVTDAYVKEDYSWLKNTLKKLNKISLLFSFAIMIMLFISPYIYEFWIGEKIKIPFNISAFMAFYTLIIVFLSPYNNYINGMGKIYLSSRLVWITVVLFIPLAILLAKTSLGVSGVILATIIINGIGIPIQIYQTNNLINRKANGIWNK
ncbi:oligosaccharide flippase family protein [Flavobacteriaceae bacterium]|nr:oligosaccharide flippase family protein [Flavobacteriaceae bacterium]